MTLQQLTLDFKLREDATFENFFVGTNQYVLNFLSQYLLKPNEQLIYFWGGPATGKSHLLMACCNFASQNKLTSAYVSFADLEHYGPEILQDLENLDVLCLDDVEMVIGKKNWEEAIFHCYNKTFTLGGRLLIAAHATPIGLGCQLNDLQSRLNSGYIFELPLLSDLEKITILQQRALQRGLEITDPVAQYLLNHYSRDLPALLQVLEILDKATLQEQKRLTIPFVKKYLKSRI
jgi:DnaA-homolog protein